MVSSSDSDGSDRNLASQCHGLEIFSRASSTTRVELKDRLQAAIELRGIGMQTLERKAGLARSVVGRLVKGEHTSPRPETLEKISTALDVSYAWLATGHGEMLPNASDGLAHVEDQYPGRADLRRTAYWRSLPQQVRDEIMRSRPVDHAMAIGGWITLAETLRAFAAGSTPMRDVPPPATASQTSAPPSTPLRARR